MEWEINNVGVGVGVGEKLNNNGVSSSRKFIKIYIAVSLSVFGMLSNFVSLLTFRVIVSLPWPLISKFYTSESACCLVPRHV